MRAADTTRPPHTPVASALTTGRASSPLAALASAAALLAPATAQAAGGGLEIIPNPATMIPLIVLFALMIVPVNRLLIQPMLRVLEERDERIAGARAKAGDVGKRADEVLASYEERVAAARDAAETERRSKLDEAKGAQADRVGQERATAEGRLEQARGEVQSALEQARGSLRAQAEQLARDAAEKMLGRSLS